MWILFLKIVKVNFKSTQRTTRKYKLSVTEIWLVKMTTIYTQTILHANVLCTQNRTRDIVNMKKSFRYIKAVDIYVDVRAKRGY